MIWLNWLPQTATARTLLTLVDAATLVNNQDLSCTRFG
jgi:hypothetical protein